MLFFFQAIMFRWMVVKYSDSLCSQAQVIVIFIVKLTKLWVMNNTYEIVSQKHSAQPLMLSQLMINDNDEILKQTLNCKMRGMWDPFEVVLRLHLIRIYALSHWDKWRGFITSECFQHLVSEYQMPKTFSWIHEQICSKKSVWNSADEIQAGKN